MLSKPVLARADNREVKAQTNPYCGDPADWFDSEYFQAEDIYAASFDFFVDWQAERVCDEVWVKRISDTDEILRQTERELLDLVACCDGTAKADRLYRFLRAQRMRQKYMLFRDVEEAQWAAGEGRIVELDMSRYGRGSIVSQLDVDEVQERIAALRNRAVPIGRGGLIYATSALEAYLSKQPYFWPGDADTVLYDGQNQVLAVIEFKKHTASSSIDFSHQTLENYLQRDILKYRSLALLRDRFRTRLFVLYYPIPADIRYLILEEVLGAPDALEAGRRIRMELPRQGREDSMRAFAEAFIRQVLH